MARLQVEAVLAKKGQGPTVQYLVKWMGFEEATWQPACDLHQSPEILEEFEKKEKEKRISSQTVADEPEQNRTATDRRNKAKNNTANVGRNLYNSDVFLNRLSNANCFRTESPEILVDRNILPELQVRHKS